MDWINDLKTFVYDENEKEIDYLSEAWNKGKNHPLYGTTRTEEWSRQHSKDVSDWWANKTPEERKKIAGTNKGKFWITNGTDSKMIRGEIPEGWCKGRADHLTEEGRKKLSQSTAKNNKKGVTGRKVSTTS